MRIAPFVLALAFFATPTEAQTIARTVLNALFVNGTFFSGPCNSTTPGGMVLTFDISAKPTATAAVLLLDTAPTSCGLLSFPPAPCYGLTANSLDIGAGTLVAVPLGPGGPSFSFATGPVFGVPLGTAFSVQGAILDPGCVPTGLLFTNAYDVLTN